MFEQLANTALGHVDKCELEHRCYNGICLAAALGCLIGAFNNTFIGLPLLATLATAFVGIIYLALYIDSRRRQSYRPHLGVYIITGAFLLTMTWFLNGGINGSDIIISIVALVALTTVLKNHRFQMVFYLFVPLMTLLFFIEYYAPQSVIGYSDHKQRFIDVYLTLVLSTTVIFAILVTILQSYKGEKKHLDEVNLLLTEKMRLLNQTNSELQTALAEIKTLTGMLPICAACKKVRDDQGYWNQIESYISDRSDAVFSHSICPACTRKLYPDLDLDNEDLN